MSYSKSALELRKLSVSELPRLDDRISFVYLDKCRVRQDATGVVAQEGDRELPIPVAGLAALLLGPGTSISAPAVSTLTRSGANVIWVSERGAQAYAAARPLTSRAFWAQAQARMWADVEARRRCARILFQYRFPALDWPSEAPLSVMRGVEGAQVRAAYREAARKAKFTKWKRCTDDSALDPVNPLLNLANSILYGAALSAVSALGLNPALGIIHQGSVSALLFDLADMHKAKSSIPIAFDSARMADPPGQVRRRMRDYLVNSRVLKRDLELLTEILGPFTTDTSMDELLDDSEHPVAGNRNYGL